MKNTNLESVRYFLGENFYKSNNRILSHGDKNVNIGKESKRYKQYF